MTQYLLGMVLLMLNNLFFLDQRWLKQDELP